MVAEKRSEPTEEATVVTEGLELVICLIRGRRVMLDADLAALYGVETKQLNRQVTRNLERFPTDFMFPLLGKSLGT